MSFTGQQLVDLARETLNDDVKARYTDTSLLLHANAALGTLALLRPDLFIQTVALPTTPNSAEQDAANAIPSTTVLRLYWIYRISGSSAIIACDLDSLSRVSPDWMIAESGDPVNWMIHPEDAKQDKGTKYLLSPPPASGVLVIGKVAIAPNRDAITLGALVPFVPDAYLYALANFIIYCAESKDDEHVVEQRAAQAMTVFLQTLGLAKEAKVFMNDGRPQ